MLFLYGSLLAVCLLSLTGQMLLRKALVGVGADPVWNDLPLTAKVQMVAQSGHFWFGVFLSVISAVGWLCVLARMEVSVALPVLGALSYVVLLVAARVYLQEHVSLYRWAGVLMLIIGTFLVAKK